LNAPRIARHAPGPSTEPGDTADLELDERRLQVVAEQAAGLRWQIALTAVIVAAIAAAAVPKGLIALWLVSVVASREWRAIALVRMARDRARPIADRLRATVRWNVLIGACNGSAALFMAWLDTTLAAVLTMILVSWGAGAVSTSSTVLRAFVAYAALLFVPTAAMWIVRGSWLGWGVAALVLMFFGVQIRFARRNLETFEESYRIRLENLALAERLASEQEELARARDVAEQANLEKSRFLAAASHDLRQPLQAITLNSGELLRRAGGTLLEPVVADLHRGVEQLGSMLDALLDLSKLDAGAVVARPRRIELRRLLEGTVASLQAAARAKGLALRVDCASGLAAHSDPDLLRRVLVNLLDNALKFTASGEVVASARPVGDAIEIAVHDTGPGIAPADQSRVFDDLVQLPGSAQRMGHGLGLGIVRRVAALLGTQVQLESAPGHGATFRYQVPAATFADFEPGDRPTSIRLAGRRIVLLDDDPMVRGAYANALTGMGAITVTAATIAEACAAVAQVPPDAAVLDHRLAQGERGFDAVARLRALAPGLAIVMLSADSSRALAEQVRALGLPLLRKPIDGETLARTLSGAIDAAASTSPENEVASPTTRSAP
jgi:signal transduction histidine kinase/ActR/RegA family two-component response regulator